MLLRAGDHRYSLLPEHRLIRPFTANAVEHRTSLSKAFDQNLYTGSLGGVMPLVEVVSAGSERRAEFSLGGTFYTSLSASEHQFIVTNGDYYVDALFDVQMDPAFALRLGIGHTSQHLMDDAIEVKGLGHSINYVRDYAQAFVVTDLQAIGGFVYAGGYYNYTFIIDTHRDGTMDYEVGCEALNYQISNEVRLYVAADIKWKGEAGFGTTQSYQLGVTLTPSLSPGDVITSLVSPETKTTRALRLALTYQTGLEERGQFYMHRVNRVSIGLYLDL
ncbi:MAG TPA: DUF1207 domain-containing protein [Bacteroidota bacterium]|nr:DUF1207 domain-containing protein [Bacteroidota bacterium]